MPEYTSPLRGRTYYSEPLESRFWAKVDKNGPIPDYAPHLGACWIWTGSTAKAGYGQIAVGRRDDIPRHPQPAHRVSWFIHRGYWPEKGRHLDHLCRVPHCVNPDHLEDVAARENMRRGIGRVAERMNQTECHKGHPLSGENLRITPANRRRCRTCHRESERARQAKARG